MAVFVGDPSSPFTRETGLLIKFDLRGDFKVLTGEPSATAIFTGDKGAVFTGEVATALSGD